jgi:hypothetical protein
VVGSLSGELVIWVSRDWLADVATKSIAMYRTSR